MEDQLQSLSARFAKVMTLQTRVGKATIAREAMNRGMALMIDEVEKLEGGGADPQDRR